jgi:Mg-chelatase subunit ChlD
VDNEKKTGIQISHKSTPAEVSVAGKGIQIAASAKPIAANFSVTLGWIYILLDCSGSMKKNRKLDMARQGVIDFTKDALKKQYRIGLITFSDDAELLCEPTDNIDTLQDQFKKLKANGGTNLTAAIIMTHNKLNNFKGPRVMVIATDGQPDNAKSSLEAASIAKNYGIDIITIGTDDADKELLKKLASRSELSSKVANEKFGQAISDASLLLPSPKSIQPR